MIAQNDIDLLPWLMGVAHGKPTKAGGFLTTLVEASLRADWENYPLLRPVLLQMRDKYPNYSDIAQIGFPTEEQA